MDFIIIGIVALLVSLLTFFSGFGLGTLLSAAFAFFFPIEIAIALTAIVHFSNNLFKLILIGKYVSWRVLKFFAPFCIAGAFGGAFLLVYLSDSPKIASYGLGSRQFTIGFQDIIVAVLMIIFAIMELRSFLKQKNIPESKLWFGGLLSGFFGGLSGHQGALRSMFLIKSNLNKEQFIATGVAIACIIDITRISIYTGRLEALNLTENAAHILSAVLPAFAGAYLGRHLLHKVDIEIIHKYVAWMLIVIAIGIGTGLV